MGRNNGTGGRGRRPGAAGVRRGVAGGGAPAPAAPIAVPPTAAQAPVRPTATPTNLLGETTTRRYADGSSEYQFRTASGRSVDMTIATMGNDGDIVFTVNGTLTRGRLTPEESNAVSLRLLRHIREDARTRPDGFTYHAFAATGDGFGLERGRAYQAIGMSRPTNGSAGGTQYAVVRNGKLQPDLERLRNAEGGSLTYGNQIWQAATTGNRRERASNR